MEAAEFKKFSFVTTAIPGSWGAIAMIALLGIAAFVGADVMFEGRLKVSPALFAGAFVLFNILSGMAVSVLVKSFKARWAYLVVLINEIALLGATALFAISSRLTFVESMALWTVFAYSIWLIMFSGLASVRIRKGILVAFTQPLFIWLLALATMSITGDALAAPLAIMALALVVATAILLFTEHLFSLVFTGMSGMGELSKFMKGIRGEQSALSIGHNIDALVQYMRIRAGAKEGAIVAPWLHSGPLRGVGGGNLSTQCIQKLNQGRGDSYFLHIPSNHEYNPSVDASGRVVRAVEWGPYERMRVSKVMKVEEGGVTVRGQRINDLHLITLASSHIDDYDISIFSGIRDKHKGKKLLIVDSHPNVPLKECINVEAFTAEAELVGKLVDSVIAKLDGEQLAVASVGTALQHYGEYSIFAMVVKSVETTLYFIVDANGLSTSEMAMIKEIANRHGAERTLFFTTDTHSLTVKSLMHREDMPRGIVESTIMRAIQDLKPGEFAYGEALVKNVRILGKTYYELSTVVKIMARVMPVLYLLLFLFVLVALWIF
jgi:predicted neutral ceramidase superfamily lipid hydrolase